MRGGDSLVLSGDGSTLASTSFDTEHIVRVYRNISNVWTQIGEDLSGSGGTALSLSADGNIIAITTIENDLNRVKIYQNISNTWTQIGQDIVEETLFDGFGESVSLSADGSIIAIGAPTNDNNGVNSGYVQIYENISNVWTQMGSDISGENENDRFGSSLSLNTDGNILAIGAQEMMATEMTQVKLEFISGRQILGVK